ncbi:ribosome-releasing factor 2, mitochondrial [Elysia marginata]|uniref:Ribosome-releasing factor 2, mitochondrial n=1 Tax=Elysia marginata TaxID=1093978 RepID=A0AAV4IJB3_9GAST|nr:ribosome-releasing factor 2, mitochondrial [Elysia marginata]
MNIASYSVKRLLRFCHRPNSTNACFVKKKARFHWGRPAYIQHDHESMAKTRNIGIMAHIDAGKTTTTERMLFYSGFSRRLGDVDHGDTVMDYMEQERERGITISSASITFNWKGHKVNLIDTPGHVDFTVEVERSLRVLDGAVGILDASAGVEAQTLTVWRQADHYYIPRLIYLNKMDKPGSSLEMCLQSVRDKLHVEPLVLNIPIGSGKEFVGVHDLVNLQSLRWDLSSSKDGTEFVAQPFNTQFKNSNVQEDYEEINKARSDLIGRLADFDEHLADLVLCDTKMEDIPAEDIIRAIRTATIKHKVVPVLCGSSLKNKGVQPLLDAINLYLPSPMDISYGFARYYGTDLCALAFKVVHDKQRGPLTFVRLYSGMLKSGANIYNINRSSSEKTSRLLQVYADELHDISTAVAGNIVAVAGLKETFTGDTLTSSLRVAQTAAKKYNQEAHEKGKKHLTEPPKSEEISDDYCNAATCPERGQALSPQCGQVEINTETGQTILSGMGELHLDIIKSRLEKEYGLDVDLGPLQIAFRETIVDSAEVTEILDKELNGKRQFVHLKLSVHADVDNREFQHIELQRSTEHPLHIKHKMLKAIENGVRSGLSHGSLLNFPVIHTSVHLHEFSTHYHTTLPMITACASMALQKALKKAGSVLLEPMMAMEVVLLLPGVLLPAFPFDQPLAGVAFRVVRLLARFPGLVGPQLVVVVVVMLVLVNMKVVSSSSKM